ncbi:hypothetical protein SCLARK_00190 [Spiroplasma clarkii]|uniref:Uncharacterized protein n=1 Tax=Spiroplasma clarkii TaxID=2139 RepID=A0A1Y0KZ09_9MOLU|nr:hypothetical protein [Spiroplasma clarkii]ARU90974.1 hypothetical protein SCLARK_00190 [Spiroplasma clarkii]ATX70416.1 hypothetical protein SCLAR_v1c00810 [Spiroplasma clarkii]
MPKGQKESEFGYSDKSDLINSFMNYNPQTDKDAKFNVASVPLATRQQAAGSNQNQDKTGTTRHHAMGVVNKNTSGTPAQGNHNFDGYNFTNWSYVDEYTGWAGAINEGIIVLPSADIIDAAHTNGTEMLGIIYFDGFFGLTADALKGFFDKDEAGNYKIVDKHIEVADYFGFDGWFWNNQANANPGTVDEAEVTAVMAQYSAKVKQQNKKQRIVMYHNALGYGDQLATDYLTNGADNYISDFGFSNGQKLENANDKEYAFKNHTMININSYWGSLKQGNYDFNYEVKGKNGYSTSYASFAMADTYKDFAQGSGVGIKQSINKQKNFRDNDKALFVGPHGDPSQVTDKETGIAPIIGERTPIIGEQFSTNFSTGNGIDFYSGGQKVSDEQFIWNHRGVTDIMPTYQWIVENTNGNNFGADFSYEKAYAKGNSVSFAAKEWDENNAKYIGGNLKTNGKTKAKLFGSNMKISNQKISMKVSAMREAIDLITKSDPSINFAFELKFANGGEKTITPTSVEFVKGSQNWYDLETDLSEFSGDTLTEIGISFTGTKDLDKVFVDLGELAVTKPSLESKLDFVDDIKYEYLIKDHDFNTANIRMYWDAAPGTVERYEVYQIVNGEYKILGTTRTNAYFVENIDLSLGDKIAVKAINKYDENDFKITIRGINH